MLEGHGTRLDRQRVVQYVRYREALRDLEHPESEREDFSSVFGSNVCTILFFDKQKFKDASSISKTLHPDIAIRLPAHTAYSDVA
jgi:hypothetical protein